MEETATSAKLAEIVSSLPNSETRPQQTQMACWVEQSFRQSRPALIEAPTGVGKTFAYLVPAILHAQQHKERVVVATATKALQDQLAKVDLPMLAQHLDFRFSVLKGRSNYLCLDKLAHHKTKNPSMLDGELVSFDSLQEWSRRSGDRSDLPHPVSNKNWNKLTVTSKECPGAKACDFGGSCLTERARHLAAQADVVVVNHALYALSLSESKIIPDHELLILDEGHQVEDTFASALTERLNGTMLIQISEMLEHACSFETHDIQTSLEACAKETQIILDTLPDTEIIISEQDKLRDLLQKIRTRLGEARQLVSQEEKANTSAFLPGMPSGQSKGALRRAETMLSSAIQTVNVLIGSTPEDYVVYVPSSGQSSPKELIATPLRIAEILSRRLWEQQPKTLVTSATLPADVAETLGLPDTTFKNKTDSPFDLQSNALLLLKPNMPSSYTRERYDIVDLLINSAGGRTLMLFTSRKALASTVKAMRKRLPSSIKILAQYETSNDHLLAMFAQQETSCLFATMSFWEGVDIPGPSCSLVIIDKLPFPVPNDPLVNARRRIAGGNDYQQWARVDLVTAKIKLAQGMGRLIRRGTDKGVVAVLDHRIVSAKYANRLLSSVPAMRKTSDLRHACGFLQQLSKPAALRASSQVNL